jgi:hypothetical protein
LRLSSLNIYMADKDSEALGEIYESLDLNSSFPDDYDSSMADVQHEVAQLKRIIEMDLKGTIAFYKNAVKKFEQNPRDMNAVEDLKGLRDRIHNTLAQYQNFT